MLFLKRLIKSQVYLTALAYIIYNARIPLRFFFGRIKTSSGTTHATLNIDESVKYIEDVFRDYQTVSGCTEWKGKIAEIGPGDNEGVACLFLANGAEQADLADRFFSERNITQQQRIHQALQKRHPHIPSMDTNGNIKGIQRFYGAQASGEAFFENNKGYSAIVSRSVLEHVDDPEHVLLSMYDALAPGGMLIHKVDLRDHGMMTPYAHDLKWMQIPQWLYTLMVKGSGYPNRFLFQDYKRVLLQVNPNCRFYIAGLNGVEPLPTFYAPEDIPETVRQKAHQHIAQHRRFLAEHLRRVPSDDLMVSSFFFVCQKPE